MNALRNKVQLIGFLGAAPEVRQLGNGKKMVKLNLATHETYKKSCGENISQTSWHQLVAWGKMADVAESVLDKGMEIAVEGKLQSRNYTDKAGIRRFITEVNVNQLLVLEQKRA